MNINEKIYTLRKQRGLSQEELANELNVSRQTVSKWELGESTPDFDKIVPLCEVFGISTEELLRDRKIEEECIKEIKDDENNVDVVKAILICISIFLYFLSLVAIIIGETVFQLNDGIVVSTFFLICGLATALIIFTCMTRPGKKSEDDIDKESKDPILNAVLKIASVTTVCIYFIISFTTMAWHITWIIFIIYAVVAEIIKLIFALKKQVKEGEKEDNE